MYSSSLEERKISAPGAIMIFGEDNIWKILFRIVSPVMLAQLIQAMYDIVDSYFVEDIPVTA